MPGETVVVRGGRIVDRRRLEMLPEPDVRRRGMRPSTTRSNMLDRTLEESVRIHQRSDVPYGLFLSGGIDSSAILALMARLNERPVRAFTVGFGDTGVHDERAHAKALASSVGAEHSRDHVR